MNLPRKRLFITGIGTDIGKTLVSAILVEALLADYWKPVQAGSLDNSDTIVVKSLISNEKSTFHSENFRLNQALSPHAAAAADSVSISLKDIKTPDTSNLLIIEGAGGLMVPLNEGLLVIDLIIHLQAEVILVSKNYLGSINHTLLSAEVLKSRGIPVTGIIFNGESVPASEDFILNYTGLKCLGRVPQLDFVNPEIVKTLSLGFSNCLK